MRVCKRIIMAEKRLLMKETVNDGVADLGVVAWKQSGDLQGS